MAVMPNDPSARAPSDTEPLSDGVQLTPPQMVRSGPDLTPPTTREQLRLAIATHVAWARGALTPESRDWLAANNILDAVNAAGLPTKIPDDMVERLATRRYERTFSWADPHRREWLLAQTRKDLAYALELPE